MLTGTFVNGASIILGGIVGLILCRRMNTGIPERFQDAVMKALALCVLYIAVGGLSDGSKTLVTIFSLVAGTLLGEWMDLDRRLNQISVFLEEKLFGARAAGFAQGFMSATLLFCVGTMAIQGSMDAGLHNTHDTLYAKSVMDGITSCIFASSLGVGVIFSAVSVVLYQGAITLLSSVAQPYLSDMVMGEMNAVGSLLLLGLSLNLLGLTKLKLMNFLPSMFLPILFCQLF